MSLFSSGDTVEHGYFRGSVTCLKDIEKIESIPLAQRIRVRSVYELVAQAAQRHPEKPAFVTLLEGHVDEEATELRYRELVDRLHQVAHLLRSLDVSRNDTVAIILPNVTEAFWIHLAVGLAGTAFPVNWMLERDALASQLTAVRPKVIIALGPTDGFQIWEKVREVRAALPGSPTLLRVDLKKNVNADADSLDALCEKQPSSIPSWLEDADAFSGDALLIGTGGTTGDPKIAPITHDAIVYKAWACISLMDSRPEHRVFGALPQFHIGGVVQCTLSSLSIGSTIVIPGVSGFRAKHVMRNYWKLVERFRITDLCGVPTTLAALSEIPVDADVSSLREVAITGSAAMPASLGRHFENVAGVRVLGGYGMTENSGTACLPPRNGDPRYGACGIRYPYTQIRIARSDDDGKTFSECSPGESGEILIKGPGLIRGYLNSSHNTRLFHDGWLRTGDMGRFGDDGYLWITGRSKDLIIRAGHNIDPRPIEDALLAHPSVSAAAAVGMPDAYAGELPMAFIQLKPDADVDVDTVLDFVRTRISERAAVPVKLAVLPAMPLTAIGKVFRPELRRLATFDVLYKLTANLIEPSRILGLHVETKAGGTNVRLNLAPSGDGDAELERGLLDVFSRFTFPVNIVWGHHEAA